MKILLANPRGYCAGVDRAIEIVERALEIIGAPIYVRHEIVHNRYVVEDLKSRGAIFVDELVEVPDNATVIFSAHGVSQQVRDDAQQRGLHIFDATCPLVTKVHMEVIRYSRRDQECILIGHQGHPEVEGTLGQYHSQQAGIYLVETLSDVDKLQVKNTDELGYVTQTTLSVEDTQAIISALKQKFPNIQGPKHDDICYATQNRQDAVKLLATQADIVIVLGSSNSSNSNRLREIAARQGLPAYLIDSASELQQSWFIEESIIGITAGASAPKVLVEQVVERLQSWGAGGVSELQGAEETIEFALPKALREPNVIANEKLVIVND